MTVEFSLAIQEAALNKKCEHCDAIIKAGLPVDPDDVPPSCRPQLALLGLLKKA